MNVVKSVKLSTLDMFIAYMYQSRFLYQRRYAAELMILS